MSDHPPWLHGYDPTAGADLWLGRDRIPTPPPERAFLLSLAWEAEIHDDGTHRYHLARAEYWNTMASERVVEQGRITVEDADALRATWEPLIAHRSFDSGPNVGPLISYGIDGAMIDGQWVPYADMP